VKKEAILPKNVDIIQEIQKDYITSTTFKMNNNTETIIIHIIMGKMEKTVRYTNLNNEYNENVSYDDIRPMFYKYYNPKS